MDVKSVVCDMCGRQKAETNHWFIAVTDPARKATGMHGIAFGPTDSRIDERQLYLVEDICGQECLHKRLSRWIDDLNATAPAPTEPKESVTA